MDNNKVLTEIINNNLVETIFQPIADIKDGHVIGYEAFSRGPEGSDLYMPIPLISQAKSYNRMDELDAVLCDNTLMNAKKRGIDSLLFMNLDTKYIFENGPVRNIIRELKKYGLKSSQIVIEFSEKSVICKFDSFINIIQQYRDNGFLICFDNVGSAYSNLFTVGKIRPDYMKIDRNLTQGISSDESKRVTLDMEMMIADLIDTRLIAEGVESREDLRALIHLGVSAAQGHIIGQPDKTIKGVRFEALQIIAEASAGATQQ
jgi:EAL domain-containing protein (putative c-di-GMP-specific phosphodiesterase class I)